ncbi:MULTISPECIES: sigma-54-dependent transcriptional regulator [Bradyrhizobium]|uniref:Sigma-54-dependent Fis family transcriptional regulator n=3 Tax=Bradyrhizobium TaxID=374 RepID=A0AAE5X960_9BRAD|nr:MULTISPECIES: sigma-54 dependent transcriptional regulator [Bradyrhizobium]MCG2628031.1 sigma-54 dependent transcriptional regulator [Bradyrhizobium zhengyangense]MCG2643150.1 sigma-54 dependent transcriptional regulator [Bradyrhizobium zhengyangense]MCG2670536.1 sigma-54 dependent transcriptional regulator [Bradyrhizobium zhengyangense]MDN4985729.1 sigma-54 dependent transcriptional regulator [Bradyrhizobium sp. WYCCWR 13022]MDT4736570.1 sigma-54 dependent transcriptional regulator [Bradyr
MSFQGTILVVDDEVRSQEALRRVLNEDFEVLCAGSAADAEKLLEGEIVHAIICDQRMPHESGVSFLKRVRELWPDPVRMIISGYSESDDIIAGLNEAGIYQYITKPWQPDRLIDIVKEAVQLYRLQKETETAGVDVKATPEHIKRVVSVKRGAAKHLYDFNRIVHAPDSPMHAVIELGRRAAEYDISVLITGESGTGKELLARAIHYGSARAGKAFVVENCGALPDELLESELFGCKKGAFTGAYQDRIGLFEVADGGTIFLDEIGETSPAFQVKLLRVLQESEIRPLGAQRVRKVDVRVVAATNRDLEAEVEAGRFRRDLYYRLAAFPVHMPALWERPMDIPLIAEGVLSQVKTSFNRPGLRFASAALEGFVKYLWPGNVRELQNEIQRMAVLADSDELQAPTLLGRRNGRRTATGVIQNLNGAASLKDRVEDLEKSVIINSLEKYEGNISRVASELGLSRVGLRNKLSRYDLRKNGKGDAFS